MTFNQTNLPDLPHSLTVPILDSYFVRTFSFQTFFGIFKRFSRLVISARFTIFTGITGYHCRLLTWDRSDRSMSTLGIFTFICKTIFSYGEVGQSNTGKSHWNGIGVASHLYFNDFWCATYRSNHGTYISMNLLCPRITPRFQWFFGLPHIIIDSHIGGRVFYTAVALLYNLGNSRTGVKVMVTPIFF